MLQCQQGQTQPSKRTSMKCVCLLLSCLSVEHTSAALLLYTIARPDERLAVHRVQDIVIQVEAGVLQLGAS